MPKRIETKCCFHCGHRPGPQESCSRVGVNPLESSIGPVLMASATVQREATVLCVEIVSMPISHQIRKLEAAMLVGSFGGLWR
jgi:hypothetical protein